MTEVRSQRRLIRWSEADQKTVRWTVFPPNELAAGLGERKVAELVQDQEVETGQQVRGAALTIGAGLSVELVDQVDDVEEPAARPVADAGPGDGDGQM